MAEISVGNLYVGLLNQTGNIFLLECKHVKFLTYSVMEYHHTPETRIFWGSQTPSSISLNIWRYVRYLGGCHSVRLGWEYRAQMKRWTGLGKERGMRGYSDLDQQRRCHLNW